MDFTFNYFYVTSKLHMTYEYLNYELLRNRIRRLFSRNSYFGLNRICASCFIFFVCVMLQILQYNSIAN